MHMRIDKTGQDQLVAIGLNLSRRMRGQKIMLRADRHDPPLGDGDSLFNDHRRIRGDVKGAVARDQNPPCQDRDIRHLHLCFASWIDAHRLGCRGVPVNYAIVIVLW